MRTIGQITGEVNARTFSDYLLVEAIPNQVDQDSGQTWSLWILSDEDLPRARTLLEQFLANPNDPKYQRSSGEANRRRQAQEEERVAYAEKLDSGKRLLRPNLVYGMGPVTLVLIAICVGIFLYRQFTGGDYPASLLISNYRADSHSPWLRLQALQEIGHGQLWRLVTPIFLHFGFLHIFFNLWWLKDLGTLIETRQGSLFLLVKVLILAVLSNLAQYAFTGYPLFGGMSGVVYGLLGYIWVRGKLDPFCGYFIHPSTMMMMMIWFALGFAGILGNIANYAHAGGLVVGLLWGYLAHITQSRR